MELLEHHLLAHHVLSILLGDVVVVPQVTNEDACLTALSKDLGSPEVLLMENSIPLRVALRIEDQLVVISWLNRTLITVVVEIVKHQARRSLRLVVDFVLLVLGNVRRLAILGVSA